MYCNTGKHTSGYYIETLLRYHHRNSEIEKLGVNVRYELQYWTDTSHLRVLVRLCHPRI